MTVSVIIPAYNQGEYLRQAVQSALGQTCPDMEVVVVDDGSTDNTAEVAQSFADSRVKYVYQANRGLSGARNTGVRCSNGEWVTFLDSDDLNLPEKHEILLDLFNKDPELGMAAGTSIIIDQHGEQLGKPFNTPLPQDLSRLLLWNPMQVCSVMIRREWLDRVGPFDESLRAYEDWDLYLRLARLGCRMAWTPAPVAKYRFHTGQMTRERDRMTQATFAVLDKFFADGTLPESWLAQKNRAYAGAHLRAAIQAYRIEDWTGGAAELDQAVRLDPELGADGGIRMAHQLSAMADSPKIPDKLSFLERVYDSLPISLAQLQRNRRRHLGECAAEGGFEALQTGDRPAARRKFLQAVRYRPGWLLNRGVLSTLLLNR